jgi:hypothetical protein
VLSKIGRRLQNHSSVSRAKEVAINCNQTFSKLLFCLKTPWGVFLNEFSMDLVNYYRCFLVTLSLFGNKCFAVVVLE